jgi:hypothetical protein
MTNPENSVIFEEEIDRPSCISYCSSILVCPVLNSEGIPKFLVALYNKNDVDSFSDGDLSTLKMMCDNLNQVLCSIRKVGKIDAIMDKQEELYNRCMTMGEILPLLDNLSNISDTS